MKTPLQSQEVSNDEFEKLNAQMKEFKCEFIHDANHRRAPLAITDGGAVPQPEQLPLVSAPSSAEVLVSDQPTEAPQFFS